MPVAAAVQALRQQAPLLSVGLLTADWMSLATEISLLEQAGIKILHFDVMDGCFCPAMTFGAPLVGAVRTSLLKDVHLMIQDPLDKVDNYISAGASIITVHAESYIHIHRVLQRLGTLQPVKSSDAGVIRGVAINPGTPMETLQPLLEQLELILVLAVNPGWGGQQFLPSTFNRLDKAKRMIADSRKDILLGVDGGINRGNIADVASLKLDLIVSGSAIFDGKKAADNVRFMFETVQSIKA
jgi:ribulose-phosphate 3-epimerase